MANLYRVLAFSWVTGNGDMHLKNFSLLREECVYRLSPAYDLLCTGLVIEDDPLALPMGGKMTKLRPADWLELASYCRLPERAARRILVTIANALPRCLALVSRSLLPESMKRTYQAILTERAHTLLE